MKKRMGSCVPQKNSEETFYAYIPPKLPPTPPIELEKLYPILEKTSAALAELSGIQKNIPNADLFIYMFVRKEALLSSQIEGTQSSFSDLILFENHLKPDIELEDVEEVSNYVKAINLGLQRLKDGFPLSIRLLKEIHGMLLSGGRGSTKLPGEIRRSQNWIGGTRPGNALFVPPPVDHLNKCLGDFELFLHDKSLPVLIQAGIAHVQFESIHPFLDGNGRLGRLLITLILCNSEIIDKPILYTSLFLKQNRSTYYSLLQEVRERGSWEAWLEFFLKGLLASAKQALRTTEEISEIFEHDFKKINTLGRARFSCEQALEYMKRMPQVSATILSEKLNFTAPTARTALKSLAALGIIEEVSGKKRDKIYVYRKYLDALEAGTEPLK